MFARAIRRIVNSFRDELGYPLNVRIGLGYGQVISGVIGSSKKTFDLWGETVNLASRMESTAENGRIQVTESLYWKPKDRYDFEKREGVFVKGVGVMDTYYLVEA